MLNPTLTKIDNLNALLEAFATTLTSDSVNTYDSTQLLIDNYVAYAETIFQLTKTLSVEDVNLHFNAVAVAS